MRIALLTYRFPFPPNRGDRLTVFNFLREVASTHEVHLFAMCERPPEAEALKAIKALGARVHYFPVSKIQSLFQAGFAMLAREPLQVAYFRSPSMQRALREINSGPAFDCVALHTVRMLPEGRLLTSGRKILMAIDTLSLSLRRASEWTPWPRKMLLVEEARRLLGAEEEAAEWADEVWLVSDVDANHYPTPHRERLRIVRHGVGVTPPPASIWNPDGRTLLLVGRMDVPHNMEAARRLCEDVLPLVRKSVPEVRVRIVGASPAPSVLRLARLPGVEVTGSVADLSVEYSRAVALVAPLTYCTGVQTKILEAASMGLPVVTTSKPAEGLGDSLGTQLWVAETDASLAAAAVSILRDPESARPRAEAARIAVLENFTRNDMLAALESPLIPPAN